MAEKKIIKKKEEKPVEESAEKTESLEEEREVVDIKGGFKGKYVKAIGRRKTAAAQVRIYQNGKGIFQINGKQAFEYFSENGAVLSAQSFKSSGRKDLDISVLVRGGGKNAQAEAVRHGVARALILIDEELRPSLKAKGWLTRDSRKVERKKPGLKKARRAPQWSKR